MNGSPIPFEWWYSGRYWYCSILASNTHKVSGCGATKDEAARDAQREALIWQGRERLRVEKLHTSRRANVATG
jgi:hypothetical protein